MADEDKTATNAPFPEVVGSLMWVFIQTRPYLANAVSAVARCLNDKTKIKKTQRQPDIYSAISWGHDTSHIEPKYHEEEEGIGVNVTAGVYEDADCVGNATYRRSVSGAAWVPR